MKKFSFNTISNKKNIIVISICIVLAVISMFTLSIANYSKNTYNLKIFLNQNDEINKFIINNNVMSLSDLKNDKLLLIEGKNEEDIFLKCLNQCEINMEISKIDNIEVDFNNNDIIVLLDGNRCELQNNSFLKLNSIFNLTLNSLSKISILFFVLSFIVIYITINMFIRIIQKVKENKLKVYDIILFCISTFIIYFATVFYLMSINKLLILIPVFGMIVFVFYYFKFKFENWQNIYLIIAGIVGISMIFIIPPGNVPDEPAHFVRSFSEYNRYIHDKNDDLNLPKSFENLMHKYTHNVHSIKEKYSGTSYISELLKNPEYYNLLEQKANYDNTKYLSFLPYLPSGIVNFLGRLLNIPIYVVFLLSRLINYIISTILCYFAIKITPKFKKLFVVVSLFPICLQQAAGIDMDYLTNSVSFIFIALILKYVYEDIKIKKKEILILIGVGIALALCKFGYFFLLFLIILIPNKNFKNKKVAILFKVLYLIIPIVISYFSNFGSVSTTNTKSDYYTIEKVLTNPVNSVKMCFKTLIGRFELDMFRGLLDGFGWSTKYHYVFILGTIASIFIILIFTSDEDNKIDKIDRIVMLGIFSIIFALLYAIAYTEWTPLTSSHILGLQSRYFIPIVLLFYISISNNLIKLNVKNKYRFYCILIGIVQLLSITSIVNGFY